MISRVHAKLTQRQTESGKLQWKIQDNKSINGLFVNNHRVPDAILEYVVY